MPLSCQAFSSIPGSEEKFFKSLLNGHFTAILPPGASSATATGINDNGDITGFLTAADGNVVGFLLKGTTYTEFSFPNGTNTMPFGINKTDQIVGSYVDTAGITHGFLLSSPLNHAK